MNWTILRLIIVGVVAFAIGLVAFLPARVAAGWVQSSTPARLEGVTGTLFQGEASYASLPGGGVNNLQWTLHPAALLLGHASAHVRFDSDLDGLSTDVSRSLISGNTQVSNATGNATAGWLAKRGGYTFLPVSGRIQLNIKDARFDDALQVSALDGQVTLSRARWELINPAIKLGSVQAVLDHGDAGVRARLTDSRGPLVIKGKATLSDNQAYTADVRLRARAGADDRLKKLLAQIGKADSEGWHRLQQRGRF